MAALFAVVADTEGVSIAKSELTQLMGGCTPTATDYTSRQEWKRMPGPNACGECRTILHLGYACSSMGYNETYDTYQPMSAGVYRAVRVMRLAEAIFGSGMLVGEIRATVVAQSHRGEFETVNAHSSLQLRGHVQTIVVVVVESWLASCPVLLFHVGRAVTATCRSFFFY